VPSSSCETARLKIIVGKLILDVEEISVARVSVQARTRWPLILALLNMRSTLSDPEITFRETLFDLASQRLSFAFKDRRMKQ